MINILICDDHPIVRQGLKDIINRIPGFSVIGEVNDGSEALQFLGQNAVDLLVLDISLPGQDGIEVLKQVKSIYPGVKVLILSMHSEEQYAQRSYRSGAYGYITKNNVVSELSKALTVIADGKRYVSDHFSSLMIEDLGRIDVERYKRLTDRELQIFLQIAVGKSIKDIASELSLSIKTVSTYRHRVLEKLKFKSNADLIRYALDKGLIN